MPGPHFYWGNSAVSRFLHLILHAIRHLLSLFSSLLNVLADPVHGSLLPDME